MKALCISKLLKYDGSYNFISGLTVGKYYEIIGSEIFAHKASDGHYHITDDDGFQAWYPMDLFKPISEVRDEKINNILK